MWGSEGMSCGQTDPAFLASPALTRRGSRSSKMTKSTSNSALGALRTVLSSIYILHNKERTLLEPKVSSVDSVRPVLGGTANKFRGRRTPYPRTTGNPFTLLCA